MRDGDGKADWQNSEPDEVETEWKLLQANSGGNAAKDELQGGADDMGDGSENVTRRYEFYRYGAAADTLDGENGEAMCDEVNPTTDPNDPSYLHGLGDDVAVTDANGDTYYVDCAAQVVVGNYIGAQMAGFDAAAPLGLIDTCRMVSRDSRTRREPWWSAATRPTRSALRSGSLPPGPRSARAPTACCRVRRPPAAISRSPSRRRMPTALPRVRRYTLHIAGAPVPQVDLVGREVGHGTGTCRATASTAAPPVAPSSTQHGGVADRHRGRRQPFHRLERPLHGIGDLRLHAECQLDGDRRLHAAVATVWSTSGGGTGTVSGNGIDCGGTCSVMLDRAHRCRWRRRPPAAASSPAGAGAAAAPAPAARRWTQPDRSRRRSYPPRNSSRWM